MTEVNSNESNNMGSSLESNVNPNRLGDEGQLTKKTSNTSDEVVPKSMYVELEKKLGEQGNELGQFRESNKKYEEWFEDTRPLWEELEKQPDLVRAITNGKISSDLVQAVIDGKVSIQEAKDVTEAHEKVKEDLGKTGYDKSTPEQINKLVDSKIKEITTGVEERVKQTLTKEKMEREYEDKVKDFVRNTQDYADYAIDINKYLELHPTLADIEIAYHAVKGIRLQKDREISIEKEKAEAAKNFATNVSSGGGRSTTIINEPDEVSKYIGKVSNPNKF